MKINTSAEFSQTERIFLLGLGLLGLLGPNGVFLYFAFFRGSEFLATMRDPVAIAFMADAFLVMGILAYYFAKISTGKKGLIFIVLSLIGGFGFSVPAFLLTNGSNQLNR